MLRLKALTISGLIFSLLPTVAFSQQGSWAAAAANGKGNWGYAVGKASRDSAISAAIQGCAAAGCHVEGAFQASCVAYVQSRSGGYWYGVGIGGSQNAALSTAKGGCSAGAPAGSCQVVKVICG